MRKYISSLFALAIFAASAPSLSAGVSGDEWWCGFGDTTLDSLISIGEQNNYDVAMAANRIEIANQALRASRAGYYPSVNLSAGWTKQEGSDVMTRYHSGRAIEDYFNLGLTASWEVDIFGRVRQGVKGKEASFRTSKAEFDGAMVSVKSQIGIAYFNLRAVQAQLALAANHCREQERVLRIAEARHEAGIGTALEVSQAKVVLYSTQASVPVLEAQMQSYINALSLLTAISADDLRPMLAADSATVMPDYRRVIETHISPDFVRNRPDIKDAEAQIEAAAAAVGIAKKDYLPTLSLTGSVGTEAHRFDDLFSSGSFTYMVAPTLSWTLFDGFSRRAAVASAKSSMQVAVDNYNLTIATAYNELGNAVNSYKSAVSHISLLDKVVEECQKSLNLSVDLYKQGLTSFTNVVDSQMNLLEYQNSLVAAQGDALVALVDIYKALGGNGSEL